jgi:hypothetical protein
MEIQTIEQAIQHMGERLSHVGMAQRAREALTAGAALEVTICVSPGKGGAIVSMQSTTETRSSHGQLIRLK